MVPGRKRGGGLVELPWPVLVLGTVLEPQPGDSTQGEDWLIVMAGLQAVFVCDELEFSVAASARVVVSGGANSVVGLLAELLVLWKGREPGLSDIVPTNPVCTPASWVCDLLSQHPP